GEAVVVSTCNRVEYYVAADDAKRGTEVITDFLAGRVGALPEAFHSLRGDDSIRHLFRVVSGLESMVIGETEILGQVKKAYQSARAPGARGPMLHQLFPGRFR